MKRIKALLSIFLSMMKIGLFTFGGAYGAIPLIRGKLRSRTMLLNGRELVLGENDELPCLCGKTVEGKLEVPATACAFVIL